MSSSAAAVAGKPSRFACAIVANTATAYHLLKIDGYSRTRGVPTGEKLKSLPFTLGGRRWHIAYYPNGLRKEYADYISFFLVLDDSLTTPAKAQCRFCFVEDMVEEQAPPSLTSETVNSFTSQQGWGSPMFIKREELKGSSHLKDDSFTVRCDVVVINQYVAKDLPDVTPPAFVSVPPSDLHRQLGELLETEKGADVVFEVGGETFAAHRCVLAARSPVFSAELFGRMKESDAAGVVRLDDMEAKVFKALLCFAYTDSLPEAKKEEEEEDVMCQHLLVAADRYNMDRLKLICEDKLCKYIDVGTVATILALAEQHHCDGLEKACFDFLGTQGNLKAVVASDGFDHLSRSCPAIIKKLFAMLAP